MDRLEELADAEHALRDKVADAEEVLERADMCLRAAKAKRREQLRVTEFFGKRVELMKWELDGQIYIEITEGKGDVAECWQAWNTAKTKVEKLRAEADHAKHTYFDYRRRTGGM